MSPSVKRSPTLMAGMHLSHMRVTVSFACLGSSFGLRSISAHVGPKGYLVTEKLCVWQAEKWGDRQNPFLSDFRAAKWVLLMTPEQSSPFWSGLKYWDGEGVQGHQHFHWQHRVVVCQSYFLVLFLRNTCWVPHLKHFTIAPVLLCSASEQTHCALVVCRSEWL